MQTGHSHFYGYVIKVIVSWLLWSHLRCQWFYTKAAPWLGLENFIAAGLDLSAIGVWLTVSVCSLSMGSLSARSIRLWSAFWLLCPSAVHLSFFLFLVGNDLTSWTFWLLSSAEWMEFPPNYNLCCSYTKPQSWLLHKCVFLLHSSLLLGMATELKLPAMVTVSKGDESRKVTVTWVGFSS